MLLIVRGDLQSETGWSRATRALVDCVADQFSVIAGVDRHFHPDRSTGLFCGGIVKDSAAMRMGSHHPGNVVLHAVLPNDIVRYAGNINLGWWFWETDALPATSDWIERINSLDHLLVPSPWQAEVVKSLELRVPVSIVPWPHSSLDLVSAYNNKASVAPALPIYQSWSQSQLRETLDIDHRYHSGLSNHKTLASLVEMKQALFAGQRRTLDTALQNYGGYFFAVQSDAPRKGLPVLISEWCRYCAEVERPNALIVRFSSLNVNHSAETALQRFSEIACSASRGAIGLEHVYVVLDQLSEGTMESLYRGAIATVSPTYGEGFGGTIVESVRSGCLPIAPRHTACAQLLPDNYSNAYQSKPYIGKLVDQLPIQPASGSWHLPVPGEISRLMQRTEKLSQEQRDSELIKLRQFMQETLSPSAARNTILAAIRSCSNSNGAIDARGSLHA
ncbi:glycosyltransferase family 4 protein [Agrobacterium rhizogenes]|uniref:glycosyltransferase n=1 Tax=Rhizobium rhizogenes TaxID=359 RepID=UPI0015733FE4|nr:hypothetical protein [Rhizobium rhizogenes]NTG88258.1 glycosyltransferase family 4 protein [Rhizobium rhizogenes]